ncbi:MAG: 2-oxo acid dehydrogenase subunit E2 [Planctomycetes bacterium]|nr:2-oxo acid dehydrogenase subunit E2 [Planctomycetota bacterium]
MAGIKLRRHKNLSSWRQIALHAWDEPGDPSVYGFVELDVKEAQDYIKMLRETTGEKVTLTHLVAKAIGYGLSQMPEVNGMVIRRKIFLREKISVLAMVDIAKGGSDLSGAKIDEVDKLSVSGIAQGLRQRAEKIKALEDEDLAKTKGILNRVPNFMIGTILKLTTWLQYSLGFDLSWMGLKPDPYGSAWLTNVANFGMPAGLAPLIRFSKTPLVLCMGEVRDKPWVVEENGEKRVAIRPVLTLGGTFDHRMMDGVQCGKLAACIFKVIEHPFTWLNENGHVRGEAISAEPATLPAERLPTESDKLFSNEPVREGVRSAE